MATASVERADLEQLTPTDDLFGYLEMTTEDLQHEACNQMLRLIELQRGKAEAVREWNAAIKDVKERLDHLYESINATRQVPRLAAAK